MTLNSTAHIPQPTWRRIAAQYFQAGGGAITFAALICVVLTVASPYFARLGNLLNLIDGYGPIALVAAGMACVIVSGHFDLSVAAVHPAAGIAGAFVLRAGHPVPLALLAGVTVGLSVGLVNGLIVTKLRVHSFVATLASSLIVGGVLLVMTGGEIVSIHDPVMRAMGARSHSFTQIGPSVLLVAATILALSLVLGRTPLGIALYAVGGNPKAAGIAGLRVDAITLGAFVVSGVLAAVAGMISLARVSGAHVDSGVGLELTAITAVVLGGTSVRGGQGGPGRTVAGVALLALIANAFDLFQIDLQFQSLAVGSVLLAAVAFDARVRSQGA